MLSLLIALGSLGYAQDDDSDLNLAGQIHMSYLHSIADDPSALGGLTGVSGVEIHVWQGGFDGDRTSASFGLELGAGRGGGFDGNMELLMGPGAWAGRRVAASLQTGLGVGGVTRRVPVALQVPIEASLVVQPLNRFRLRGWARSTLIAGANHPRKAGTTTVPVLDEFRFGVDAYLGEMLPVDSDGDLGWHIGFSWEEVMGTRLLGAQIGFALGETPERADPLSDLTDEDWDRLGQMFDGMAEDGSGGEGGLSALEVPVEDPEPQAEARPAATDACAVWGMVVEGFADDFASYALGPHPDDASKRRTELGLPEAAGSPFLTDVAGAGAWVQPLWTGDSAEAGLQAWTQAADALTDCSLPGTWIAERSQDGSARSAWWVPFDARGTGWEGKRLEILLEPIPDSDSWRVMARARAQ